MSIFNKIRNYRSFTILSVSISYCLRFIIESCTLLIMVYNLRFTIVYLVSGCLQFTHLIIVYNSRFAIMHLISQHRSI